MCCDGATKFKLFQIILFASWLLTATHNTQHTTPTPWCCCTIVVLYQQSLLHSIEPIIDGADRLWRSSAQRLDFRPCQLSLWGWLRWSFFSAALDLRPSHRTVWMSWWKWSLFRIELWSLVDLIWCTALSLRGPLPELCVVLGDALVPTVWILYSQAGRFLRSYNNQPIIDGSALKEVLCF